MGDLLTMHKSKNTVATSHFHNDQHNLPRAAHISLRICSDNVFSMVPPPGSYNCAAMLNG